MNDWELIQEYNTKGSQEAFEKIVQLYGPMVYSACLRQLGDHHQAEEAGQAVFITLSRKIGSFGRNVMLPVWLYRTASFAVKELRRSISRQKKKDSRAGELRSEEKQDADWEEIRPHIDNALDTLNKKQKEAIILHYMQGLTQKETAERLGCKEDAIQKRIQRGLEKLKARLSARGIGVSGAVLSGLLVQEFADAAPAAVLSSFAQTSAAAAGAAAGAAGTAAGTALTGTPFLISKGVCNMFILAKIKAAIITAVIGAVCLGGGGVVVNELIAEPEKPVQSPVPQIQEPAQKQTDTKLPHKQIKAETPPAEKGEKNSSETAGNVLTDGIPSEIGYRNLKKGEIIYFDSILEWEVKPGDKEAEVFIKNYSMLFPQVMAEYIIYRAEVTMNDSSGSTIKVTPLWAWRIGAEAEVAFQKVSEELWREPFSSLPASGTVYICTNTKTMYTDQKRRLDKMADFGPTLTYLGLPDHIQPVHLKWPGFKPEHSLKQQDKDGSYTVTSAYNKFKRYYKNVITMETEILGVTTPVYISVSAEGKGSSEAVWEKDCWYPRTSISNWTFNLSIHSRFKNIAEPADPKSGVKGSLILKRHSRILDRSLIEHAWPSNVDELFDMMSENRLEYWKKVNREETKQTPIKRLAQQFILDMKYRDKKGEPWAENK